VRTRRSFCTVPDEAYDKWLQLIAQTYRPYGALHVFAIDPPLDFAPDGACEGAVAVTTNILPLRGKSLNRQRWCAPEEVSVLFLTKHTINGCD